MDIPDVNVLINAFRSDLAHHNQCREWLETQTSANTRFGISQLALSSFVRITTNAKAFIDPNTTREALSFAEALLELPHCVPVNPGEQHWTIFTRLCRTDNVVGNLVPDAYFAALAIEHSCRWVTLDRDFLKFKGLRTKILPLQQS